MAQKKQNEWEKQWRLLEDNEHFLFEDWIYPNNYETFKDKTVLECGCGGGQHTGFVAPHAESVTAVDLNTIEIAEERNRAFENITYVENDIAVMDLGKQFDVVFSIGVVHHTDDPDKTVRNMIRHTKPGGRVIIWVYSREGNGLVKFMVEPLRKMFLRRLSRESLITVSEVLTLMMYMPIYSIYLLPLKQLPFFEYFQNFRKLSFYRNMLNVFDKLNAPQVQFITKERAKGWLPEDEFSDIHISAYKGVSWRISGTKK